MVPEAKASVVNQLGRAALSQECGPLCCDRGLACLTQSSCTRELHQPCCSLLPHLLTRRQIPSFCALQANRGQAATVRSEEHPSELQSLMRTSYAVFCLKKKNNTAKTIRHN